MRWAGNFNPEWGYLAPAPSFMRTVRVVVVASAVGATAGAGVVVALVEHPATAVGDTSIAAHAVVTSVQPESPEPRSAPTMTNLAASHALATSVQPASPEPAPAPTLNNPGAAQLQVPAPPPAQPAAEESALSPPPAGGPARTAGTSEASTVSTPQAPAGIAALAEVPSTTEAATPAEDEATVAPNAAPAEKKAVKKHHPGGYEASRAGQRRGDSREKSANTDRGLGSLLRHFFSARTGPSSYPN